MDVFACSQITQGKGNTSLISPAAQKQRHLQRADEADAVAAPASAELEGVLAWF